MVTGYNFGSESVGVGLIPTVSFPHVSIPFQAEVVGLVVTVSKNVVYCVWEWGKGDKMVGWHGESLNAFLFNCYWYVRGGGRGESL